MKNNFLQTVKIASGYFAVAAGVSQTDTPLPGPADVVSAVMLAAGLIVCAGIASYTTITAPVPAINTPNHAKKSKSLEDIAARHGIGECVEAAREMKIENVIKEILLCYISPMHIMDMCAVTDIHRQLVKRENIMVICMMGLSDVIYILKACFVGFG